MAASALRCLIVVGILALAGCDATNARHTNEMSALELQTVQDNDICGVFRFVNRPSAEVNAEATRRGLRDCSPEHLTCRSFGFQFGTPEYGQCRMAVLNQEAAQAQQSAATTMMLLNSPLFQPPPAPPPPTQTSCVRQGAFLNCTSY